MAAQLQDYSEVTDQELARLARDGSLSSFEQLVYRYEARLFRFLLKCSRCEDDAQELTQVSFVTAFGALGKYDPEQAFSPWLFTIARRKFIDHCRRHRSETDVIPEGSNEEDPSVIMDRAEHRQGVWDWVRSSVGDEQFQALWLYYQEQLTIKEIARALDRSAISVKVMLFRAKRVLAKNTQAFGRAGVVETPVSTLAQNITPESR